MASMVSWRTGLTPRIAVLHAEGAAAPVPGVSCFVSYHVHHVDASVLCCARRPFDCARLSGCLSLPALCCPRPAPGAWPVASGARVGPPALVSSGFNPRCSVHAGSCHQFLLVMGRERRSTTGAG